MDEPDLEALAKSYPLHVPYVAADLQRLSAWWADEKTRPQAEGVLKDWIDNGAPLRSALSKAWRDKAMGVGRFNIPESPLSPPPGDGKPVAGDVGGRVKVTPVSTAQSNKGVQTFPDLATGHDASGAVAAAMQDSTEESTVDGVRDATSVPDRFGFGGAAQRALMARNARRKAKKEAWAARAQGMNKSNWGATTGGLVGGIAGFAAGGPLGAVGGVAGGSYLGSRGIIR